MNSLKTIEKVHRFELNLVPSSSSTIDDVEKYQRLLTDFASRVQVKKISRIRLIVFLSLAGNHT
jgi:hypothetical protein